MENIKKILKEHFNIHTTDISPLEGYDSINYRIASKGANYVLKVHENTPENRELLAAEHQILKLLQPLSDAAFPKHITTLNQDFLVPSEVNYYRLLTFLEGDFIGNVKPTPELFVSLGKVLAFMDAKINNLYLPAIAAKISDWDLQHTLKSKVFLQYIPNPKDRSLVDYFFLQFEEQVVPFQYELRKGIIHGDANDWNVLTQNGRVSGIIDFGDMCHSWIINEVAIAITYAMMEKNNPLECAAQVIKGYHEINPLTLLELDVLYYLIAGRLCISVCHSAYSKTIKPQSDYITISEKPAWGLLRTWLSINPLKAKNTFRKAAGYPLFPIKSKEELLAKRKTFISDALSLSYNTPITMERSCFQYMYDSDGNTFLDAYNNIMLVGHCHPKVVRAAQNTMAKLNTNTRYLYEELLQYSEKLLSKFPATLNKVFFVNSGSAASDLAIRMAQTHTRKEKIMVLEHGYHGNTKTGIAISHYKYSKKNGVGKQDFIVEAPLTDFFNSGFTDTKQALSYYCSETSRRCGKNQGKIAAFIAEPIVGCGGQAPLIQGYLPHVYEIVRAQGGICISDEVQVGFGRLGDYFWGYDMYNVVPDMVILGKPMGNGHPIGAVVTTEAIAESFTNGVEFFSSFGGNPVSCAIGKAVLDVIEEEELQAHAKIVGAHLIGLLKELQKQFVEIADVRGSGLFLGVEIRSKDGKPDTELAAYLKNGLRDRHILIGTDGPYDSVLKIKPPLSFSLKDAKILVEEMKRLLEKAKHR